MDRRSMTLGLVVATSLALPTAAVTQQVSNGGFEERSPARPEMPLAWAGGGLGYEIALDSLVSYGSGLSLRMSRVGDGQFASAGQGVDPEPFRGQQVTLSGYVRTRDVDTGYAGLWIRFDAADGDMLYLDNMSGSGAQGTTEWTRFEVTGIVDEDVGRIIVGALLPGTGTAWFDDLSLAGTPLALLPAPSDSARAYLERAMDLMRDRALRGDSVDWDVVRPRALARAAGAEAPPHTYEAIRYALGALGDNHSFLRPPTLPSDTAGQQARAEARSYGVDSALLEGGLGYVSVPAFDMGTGDAQRGFALEVQGRIRAMDRSAPCGWIVDLRRNGGGNMWPMLAGLGPILGEGQAGGFVDKRGAGNDWGYDDGEAWLGTRGLVRIEPYRLRAPDPPVAVLTGPRTASSGEAVVVAFKGRPNTRSFGLGTAGLSTANNRYRLSDGADLLLTVSVFADRTGTTYGHVIVPDEVVRGPASIALESDPVVLRASDWLRGLPECRR